VEIILLENMRNLGALGDTVKVKPGFARNCLVPQGKAVYATNANIEKFNQRRAELEKIAAEKYQQALVKQQAINALPVITITVKAGEEGKLFGSIGTRDIVDAINKAGGSIEKRQVRLSEGALRMIGEYDITIELEGDVTATVKLNIVAEG
jgi:large subunit ribosomal protein L9